MFARSNKVAHMLFFRLEFVFILFVKLEVDLLYFVLEQLLSMAPEENELMYQIKSNINICEFGDWNSVWMKRKYNFTLC